MAKRPSPPAPKPASMTQDQIRKGIRRIERRMEAVRAFDPNNLDPSDPWSTTRPLSQDIETALTETFGHDTVEYHRFKWASTFDWPVFIGDELPHFEKVEHVAKDKQRSMQLLGAAISLLQERLDDEEDLGVAKGGPCPPMEASNRIFVVHGHDGESKEAVARFLERLGYEPIILHEQANKGRTIIQKFQDEAADVGFAVVLLSADDELTSGTTRARQNVILELGFFLGRLGLERVAAIVNGDVEVPSDFSGVLYIPFDTAWKQALAKELVAAGYSVDWNVVMA